MISGEKAHQQIQELEKANRVLRKKLDRSERERQQIESDISAKEFLLKKVIDELQTSKQDLEQRGHDLKVALVNMQTMQLQLIQSEKASALGQTVAGVAHEINNPISFIYGNLGYLTEYIEDLFRLIHLYQLHLPVPPVEIEQERERINISLIEKDVPMILQSMNNGTQRIRDIILALRNFSRLDEVGHKAVDLHTGIENTLLILQQRIDQIQVVKNYGELPLVTCVAADLNQAFMSIFNNAIDAIVQKTQAGQEQFTGEISIQTELQADQQVRICIVDNGIGIPLEAIDKVFDPFFTTKEIGKGMGLGLAIARQIIEEKHDGCLDVKSEPGQKTAFVIHLPVDRVQFIGHR